MKYYVSRSKMKKEKEGCKDKELRARLIEKCEDVTADNLPAINEYLETGSLGAIHYLAEEELVKCIKDCLAQKDEPIRQFAIGVIKLVEKYLSDEKQRILEADKQKWASDFEKAYRQYEESKSKNLLTIEERLRLVELCSGICVNDLPAITEYVMTGNCDALNAKLEADALSQLSHYAIYNGNPMPMYFMQKVAKYIQHCFGGSETLSEVSERLSDKLSSILHAYEGEVI